MTDKSGLYLHIPFCTKKCNYCDFYSSFVTEELLDSYSDYLKKSINQWGGKLNRPIDTIYLGGGTPSLMGHRLKGIVETAKKSFSVSKDAEITLELNPSGNVEKLLESAKEAGVNRLSVGAQSGDDTELKTLGRTHSAEDTVNTVNLARKSGFKNISLDLMIGLPDSDTESLDKNLKFITSLNPEHISPYILKIEENTVFGKIEKSLNLPDDDKTADQYLYMCDFLEKKGYNHYEISNFAKENFESRHNLKYWTDIDYLGIGPSAHSSIDGKRFYYSRSLKDFMSGKAPLYESESGGKEEFVMLRLRLKNGFDEKLYKEYFGTSLPKEFLKKCETFKSLGFMNESAENISLTNKGMLISNAVITELLECI